MHLYKYKQAVTQVMKSVDLVHLFQISQEGTKIIKLKFDSNNI